MSRKLSLHRTATCILANSSSFVKLIQTLKDVLMGIPKRDLLGVTVAVLQTAGY